MEPRRAASSGEGTARPQQGHRGQNPNDTHKSNALIQRGVPAEGRAGAVQRPCLNPHSAHPGGPGLLQQPRHVPQARVPEPASARAGRGRERSALRQGRPSAERPRRVTWGNEHPLRGVRALPAPCAPHAPSAPRSR